MECLDLTVFLFAGIFFFVFLPGSWYLQSVCVIPGRAPLVTIVLANIRGQSSWYKHRTSSSHRTKLSREGTSWFNLFWSSLYLSNLLLSPPPILCSWSVVPARALVRRVGVMMMTGIILSLIFPLGLKMRTDIHAVTKDENITQNVFIFRTFSLYNRQTKLVISRVKT